MRCPLYKLLAVLCALVVCPGVRAQSNAQNNGQNSTNAVDPRAMVKPDPKKAKKLVELGEKEEAAGAYEQALALYEEAARYAPFDVTIVSKGAALRSKLVRGHWDSAEKLALDGNLEGATEQMALALTLDPSNKNVLERLKEMEAMQAQSKDLPVEERPKGLIQVAPDKVTRSFHLQTDTKGAYEQVAAAYGLKVLFDPDLASRNVKLRLENVDFETAMKVLTTETRTFWTALEPKRIFVAADTTDKRRQYEPEVEQTFVLPEAISSTEITELVRVVREMTGAQKIQQSQNAHTVTIRDTAEKVQLAGEIIHDLQRSRGEVLLDIDILEVDKNKAAQYGITPPSSITAYSIPPNLISALETAPSLTALLTLLTSVFGTSASGGLSSAIPPLVAIGGGKSTFLLTLPSATATFSDSLSLVYSGQQVLLRAQDGKAATFFVGERYPITLSLLSGSLGSVTQTPSVGGTAQTALTTQQFSVGNGPVSMVTADFRSIGDNDLAVLNQIDNTLTILLNQGIGNTPQFVATTGSPISLGTARTQNPPVPASLATGSLNSNTDSFPDLLVVDPVANTVSPLKGNGDGTFTAFSTTPIAVGKQPSAIVTGTFNQNTNSNTGFVVTNFTDNTYSVFVGNGDGTFTQVTGSPFKLAAGETGPIAVTSADFNQDGIPDLAIVCQGSNEIAVLQGNGNGTFTEVTGSPYKVGTLPVAIASGTLSGSTGPALAVVNQKDNTITVFLGNGNGTFVTSSQSPIATDTTPTGVVIADFLQQGLGGIAVTNTGAGTVTVYADEGSGLFVNALEPAAGTDPYAILAGDFASGTFPDVVVTNNLSGTAGMVTLLVSPTSLVSNPAISEQPYPGSEYEDIGLKIKATPAVHSNKEVTLQMEFEIRALAGSNFNGIPVITNHTVNQTVRLKEDETTIISGMFDKEETKTLTGLPWLAKTPGAWPLFGSLSNSLTDTEVLILVTPRKVRIPDYTSRSIYAGRGDPGARGGLGGGAPVNVQPQPEERPIPPGENPETPPAQAPQQQPQPGQPPQENPAPQQPPQQPPAQQQPPQQPDRPPDQ